MRLIVCGSRDWTDEAAIHEKLQEVRARHGALVTLVHGDCPTGADHIARRFAESHGWRLEAHPAAWNVYGGKAGPIRNTRMAERGANLCLAFHKDGSYGTAHMIREAHRHGIPTVVTKMRTVPSVPSECEGHEQTLLFGSGPLEN